MPRRCCCRPNCRSARAAVVCLAAGLCAIVPLAFRNGGHDDATYTYRQCQPEPGMVDNMAAEHLQEVPTVMLFPGRVGTGKEIEEKGFRPRPLVNIALGRGRWTRHSRETTPKATPSRAVDGALDSPGCSMAMPGVGSDETAWWELDLGSLREIEYIEVILMPADRPRQNGGVFPHEAERLVWQDDLMVATEVELSLVDHEGRMVECGILNESKWSMHITNSACRGVEGARRVRIASIVPQVVVGLCEVRVFGPAQYMDAAVQLDGTGRLWRDLVPGLVADAHCDLASGQWVRDDQREIPAGYVCGCVTDKHAHCGLSYLDYTKWTWQPTNCNLPPFSAERFVDLFSNSTVNVVGDSLARGLSNSLGCMLHVHQDPLFNVQLPKPRFGHQGANNQFTAHVSRAVNVTWTLSNYLVQEAERGFIEHWDAGPIIRPQVPDRDWWPPRQPNTVLLLHTGRWWEPTRWGEKITSHINNQPSFWFERNCSGNCRPLGAESGVGKLYNETLHALVKHITRPHDSASSAHDECPGNASPPCATWTVHKDSFLGGCVSQQSNGCPSYNSKAAAQEACVEALDNNIPCAGVVHVPSISQQGRQVAPSRWEPRSTSGVFPSSTGETAVTIHRVEKKQTSHAPDSVYFMPFIPGCAHACRGKDSATSPALNDWSSLATRTCEVTWNESIQPPCARCSFLHSMASAADEASRHGVRGGFLNATFMTRLRVDAFSCAVAPRATNEPGIHQKRDKDQLKRKPHWPQCLEIDGAHPTLVGGVHDTWNEVWLVLRQRELAERKLKQTNAH